VVLFLLATLAKQERVRLSERVTAGLARARKAGRTGGRPKVIVSTTKIRKRQIKGSAQCRLVLVLDAAG
jgi:DNA invertase Pin-like site-specific DNA recombinase